MRSLSRLPSLVGGSRRSLSVVSESVESFNKPVWDDHEWRQLPRVTTDIDCDVCVVGLGGSGLACILELLSLGQRVVGVDAGSVACGAAGRNGGFLLGGVAAFHHAAVEGIGRHKAATIYKHTLAELDRMTKETPNSIRRTGSLRIAATDDELADCAAQFTSMRADGLPVEFYKGPEGAGLLFPADGCYNPLRRCRSLADLALSRGAALYENTPATIGPTGESVASPAGTITARRGVIVCVDGRLDAVLPELEDEVRTARLQMLATSSVGNLINITRPVYSRDGYEYWQQLPDGRIALGGYRDKGGDAEWTDAGTPSDHVQRLLDLHLREEIKVGACEHTRDQVTVTHRWAASVGMSGTILPVFREVRDKVWAVGGYNGTGNIVGAVCGRAAARLVVNGKYKNEVAALFGAV